jgi:hypothetical protein
MSRAHLTPDADWINCTAPACTGKFHLEDTTAAAARELPWEMMVPLLNAMDAPDAHLADGTRLWHHDHEVQGNTRIKVHRDYDLPATIQPDGTMIWLRDGKIHRDHDRPAIVRPSGRLEWFNGGTRHRDGGKPAIIHGSRVAYFNYNVEVDQDGKKVNRGR